MEPGQKNVCPNCGNEIASVAMRCSFCNEDLAPKSQPSQSTNMLKKPVKPAYVVVPLVLLGLGFGVQQLASSAWDDHLREENASREASRAREVSIAEIHDLAHAEKWAEVATKCAAVATQTSFPDSVISDCTSASNHVDLAAITDALTSAQNATKLATLAGVEASQRHLGDAVPLIQKLDAAGVADAKVLAQQALALSKENERLLTTPKLQREAGQRERDAKLAAATSAEHEVDTERIEACAQRGAELCQSKLRSLGESDDKVNEVCGSFEMAEHNVDECRKALARAKAREE